MTWKDAVALCFLVPFGALTIAFSIHEINQTRAVIRAIKKEKQQ